MGVTLLSLLTKPDLDFFTVRTMFAWDSMGWETKRKEMPPSRASAAASFSPETDCITAETSGTLMLSGLCSPTRNLHTGVLRETFCGMHAAEEKLGTSRYSENVCEGSS